MSGPSFVPPAALAAEADRAVIAAVARLGVRRSALFWLGPGGQALTCIATAGPGGDHAAWLGQALPAGAGMAGRAVAQGRVVWTPDLLADAQVPIASWLRARLEREDLRAVAAAPVRVGGRVQGALGFLDRAGRTFGAADLDEIGRVAADAAARLATVVTGDPAGA